MSYNGSGTFNINTAGQPVVAGTVISAATFNALTADLATGLTTALTKDGQTTATARIPFAQGISSTLVTDASSVSTGSIITAGGVGIAKKLYVGTDANVAGSITSTLVTDASSASTGAIITAGGVGIAKKLYVGTDANIAGTLTTNNVTLGGVLSCADQVVNRPVLEDYAIQGSAIGNTGATRTFDLTVANFFSATLDQACTFTFSNPPASGDFGCFVLELTNGGAFVITFPASVDWPGGTAPTLTASGKDQLVFTTRDGGTNYFGFVAGLDIKSP